MSLRLQVLDTDGNEAGYVQADSTVWEAKENIPLLHQVVTGQLAALRQGDHQTLTRGQVNYSTRKLRQQKKSGRARLGSRGSPALVGGGLAHGPHPRSYNEKTPHKMRIGALKVALSAKRSAKKLTVLSEFTKECTSTSKMKSVLDKLGTGSGTLVVTAKNDPPTVRSLANLNKVSVTHADVLSALTVTKAKSLVFTKDAVKTVDGLWGEKNEK